MKRFWFLVLVTVLVWTGRDQVLAEVEIGEVAPDFVLTDIAGERYRLSDYAGQIVVLEWTNYDCPFVRKHYESGNMQELQKKYTAMGINWLSVCSSAPGNQGYFSIGEWSTRIRDFSSKPTAVLLDPEGKVGRMFAAKTTPHMYVIDRRRVLIYQGGIDSIKSVDPADIPKAIPYVANALDEALARKPVTRPLTQAYGCSVKYAKQ